MQNRLFVLLCALMFASFPTPMLAEDAPFPPPPPAVSAVATLVSEDEPGERLTISGTVYKEDGKTPYDGFILYLYQTDASGVYNKTDRNWQRPRIRGWVKTDKDGNYEIRTIKPGSYPGSRNPAHIHVIVKLPGREPDWIEDFLFDGDPFLNPRDVEKSRTRGALSNVMVAAKDGKGGLSCKRNIVIGE